MPRMICDGGSKRDPVPHLAGATGELARQDEIAVQAEAADWLAQAMTRLSPELRDTVALVLGEEMTQGEAGVVLGVSEGTIAWRMSEVKKRLRAMAKEEAK